MEAAEQAADRTFSTRPSLPLDQDRIANAAALEGRQRLTGAFLIELSRIRPDADQPRRTIPQNAQAELEASIERLGILQPITVRYVENDHVYQVISGERRYQAAKSLGLREIPCWIKTPKGDEILVHQIVENWQRRDLEPLELARALALLRDSTGFNQKQLAEMTGKPQSEISRFLSMMHTDPEVQKQAQDEPAGTFTKRHLVAIARLKDPAQQRNMAEEVREKKLTAIETERQVQDQRARNAGSKTRGAPLTQRFRYTTEKAMVTITFRRRNNAREDVLAALDEVRKNVSEDTSEADRRR